MIDKQVKKWYIVRQWPADAGLLIGTPAEVFSRLKLTGRGSKQAEFLAEAEPGDQAVFLNGTLALVGP